MSDASQFTLEGSIAWDPEQKHLSSGSVLTLMKVLTEIGKRKDYHRVKVWGTVNASKGARVKVTGRIEQNSFEKNGVKQYVTDLVADGRDVIVMGEGSGQPATSRQDRPAPRQPAPPPDDFGGGGGDLGDIPFGPHNAHESW